MNLFRHPEFMAIAAALIAVPIIIHLINRLRFKRIRWAAMEFLLKAQKRNRRRLIIEQLLLLAMRCMLVGLVGFMVMRFVGVSFADMGIKKQLHIVVLDDSLSMNDRWKKQETDETYTNCFEVARNDLLIDKIVAKLRQATPTDRLVVLQLSKSQDDKEPKIYDQLTETSRFEQLKKDVAGMQTNLLHLKLHDGVKRARKLAEKLGGTDVVVTLHVLSDFRQSDWTSEEGVPLQKELIDFATTLKAKVFLLDATFPARSANQQNPPARDNIGIVDLRPRSRVVGKDVPVAFTLTLANYGVDSEVDIDIYDHTDGKKRVEDLNFNPPLPLKLNKETRDKDGLVRATFEIRFSPNLKPGQTHIAALSAHLRPTAGNNLEKDGLTQDNVAYGVVEIRNQVPILIVDGEGKAGYEEDKKGRDSFFLKKALISVPSFGGREEGAAPLPPYRVDFGDELGGGVSMKALESPELHKYPTIILANVPSLSNKQLENLDAYVSEGGGVCFFMGPLVSPRFYNDKLWKKGIFPVKLKEPYFPASDKPKLEQEFIRGVPMLVLHEELSPFPIFGPIVKDPKQREFFEHLPVYRYFKVDRPSPEQKVQELATLPNENLITEPFYQAPVLALVTGPNSKLGRLLERPEFARFAPAFQRYRDSLTKLVEPGSLKKPYYLTLWFTAMLMEKGKDSNGVAFNMEEFWKNVDLDVQGIKTDIEKLLSKVRDDGDPFVLASRYGKGKVVTVLSSAGKLWNEWAGGSKATVLFQPFIWEIQNYLSAQSVDTNLLLGQPLTYTMDVEPYLKSKRSLKMVRTLLKLRKDAEVDKSTFTNQVVEEIDKVMTFHYPHTDEPGVYLAQLVYEPEQDKQPLGKPAPAAKSEEPVLASRISVFNLDTMREGALERVSSGYMKANLIDKAVGSGGEKFIVLEGSGLPQTALGERPSDLSENPLFFLGLMALLVIEQALAVHLSFHHKGNENQIVNPADVPHPTAA